MINSNSPKGDRGNLRLLSASQFRIAFAVARRFSAKSLATPVKLLDRLTKPLVQFADSLAFVFKDPYPAEQIDLIGSAVLIRLKFDVLVGEMKCGEYQDAKLNAKPLRFTP